MLKYLYEIDHTHIYGWVRVVNDVQSLRAKETMETIETSNMQIQNCMERQRLKMTKETMETSGDT